LFKEPGDSYLQRARSIYTERALARIAEDHQAVSPGAYLPMFDAKRSSASYMSASPACMFRPHG
jgi:hypothetical protein